MAVRAAAISDGDFVLLRRESKRGNRRTKDARWRSAADYEGSILFLHRRQVRHNLHFVGNPSPMQTLCLC
jgi:hypothetical protein